MTATTYPGSFLPDEEELLFPFGLSFYQQEGETGFEQYNNKLKDEDIFSPSSFLYNDNNPAAFDWPNFTTPYQDLDLFEFNPTGPQDLLLDTPSSSFPSSPISSFSTGSSALSPPEQQEVNDIISSLQDTATPGTTQHLSSISSSISSSPTSSPPLSPFPTPSLPQKRASKQVTPPSPKRAPQSRGGRKSKLSRTDKKERKKEQNKTAAVRYRQKKREELDSLTKQEMALLQSNEKLREEVDSITAEIDCLKRLWGEVCQAKGMEPTLPYNSPYVQL